MALNVGLQESHDWLIAERANYGALSTREFWILDNAAHAVAMQIPQEVVDIKHFGRCPVCDCEFNSELLNEYNIKYCPWCGQKLDWQEID